MKTIKNKINYLVSIATLAVILCFAGCDKVEDPYYYSDPEPNVPLYADSVKKVLLEDYTGMRCTNCPDAARLAEEIAAGSRNRVIVMAVHAGNLAMPGSGFTLDLRSPEGNTYFSDFKLTGTPKGLINRSLNGTIHEYSSSEWGNATKEELSKEITFRLKAEGSLANDGTTINAKISYTATKPLDKEYNMLVFLVEDGIVGMQADGATRIPDYVFHNVLRETLHGEAYYGVPIGNPEAGIEYTKTFDNYVIKSIDKKQEGTTYKLIVTITQKGSNYIEQVEEIVLK